jgi:hypothetical protein
MHRNVDSAGNGTIEPASVVARGANHTTPQGSEDIRQRKPPDLASQDDLTAVVKTDEVEDILANVDADGGDAMGLAARSGLHGMVLLMWQVKAFSG